MLRLFSSAARGVIDVDTTQSLNVRHMRRRFDRAAATFDASDFVHAATRDGLFRRLEPVTVDASVVVDLGCATGNSMRALEKRFRSARVVGIDLSRPMLERARAKRGWFSRSSFVQADARALPLADRSVDVVFSNLLLPWISDPASLAGEVARVLRDGGVFAFATFGPDSLSELRAAWEGLDELEHVHRFPDMHDVGDALVRAGLRDPVLDVDRLAISYDRVERLFADLTSVGARNSLAARRRDLSGKAVMSSMKERLEGLRRNGEIRLELELVFGHCWGTGSVARGRDARIDPASIRVRRR